MALRRRPSIGEQETIDATLAEFGELIGDDTAQDMEQFLREQYTEFISSLSGWAELRIDTASPSGRSIPIGINPDLELHQLEVVAEPGAKRRLGEYGIMAIISAMERKYKVPIALNIRINSGREERVAGEVKYGSIDDVPVRFITLGGDGCECYGFARIVKIVLEDHYNYIPLTPKELSLVLNAIFHTLTKTEEHPASLAGILSRRGKVFKRPWFSRPFSNYHFFCEKGILYAVGIGEDGTAKPSATIPIALIAYTTNDYIKKHAGRFGLEGQ